MLRFDTLIIGSGLAGLSLALKLADRQKVAVITKKSFWTAPATGLRAELPRYLSSEDSLDEHIHDTLIAGAGLCDLKPTRYVVEHGRLAIDWLIAQGVPFTRDPGQTISATTSPAKADTAIAASSMPPMPPAKPCRTQSPPRRAPSQYHIAGTLYRHRPHHRQ